MGSSLGLPAPARCCSSMALLCGGLLSSGPALTGGCTPGSFGPGCEQVPRGNVMAGAAGGHLPPRSHSSLSLASTALSTHGHGQAQLPDGNPEG